MIFETNQTIVFAGDSITDAGHDDAAPYGDGYVNLIDMLLEARFPDLKLHTINRGMSGDTVRDLAARWETDVLAQHPDWLSVMVGVNDVWRAFGFNPHESVPLPAYAATLHDLLWRVQENGARLIVMTPYLIEPDRRDLMRRQVELYAGAARQIASELDALLVDTQAAFDAALERHPSSYWSGDRVHLSTAGHALLARAWLEAVGVTW